MFILESGSYICNDDYIRKAPQNYYEYMYGGTGYGSAYVLGYCQENDTIDPLFWDANDSTQTHNYKRRRLKWPFLFVSICFFFQFKFICTVSLIID